MAAPQLTTFQTKVQGLLKSGKSVLMVAPTGLGKTLAVTADLQDKIMKIIYAVPLRSLGVGIRDSISELSRKNRPICPKIHHGDTQESVLFSEEVVVTTYDQVVCGVPGLPLSLPLRSGHAVAGALLMSRLILDEVHLAWGISPKALSILLGIIDFRRKLGLQTVLQTATLPTQIAALISREMGLELVILGEGDCATDEGLKLRNENRRVMPSSLFLKTKGKGEGKSLDFDPLDEVLCRSGKRIYFANTVGRLQATYDRLLEKGIPRDIITVLHNRMPGSSRQRAERLALERFGKCSAQGNWLLLTNQVAEAGLDISAPVVVSDPAPVDTLVQRAGRCARWFRNGKTQGQFSVLTAPTEAARKELSIPYKIEQCQAAVESLPTAELAWSVEQEWVSTAWGGNSKDALDAVQRALEGRTFALNLFDRAAQQQSPGEIAASFREILSTEIAVEDANSTRDLQGFVDSGFYPETSSVSIAQALLLLRNPKSQARAVRYEDGAIWISKADYVRPGDIIVISSAVAVLHPDKGLCFDKLEGEGVKTQSDWSPRKTVQRSLSREDGHRQSLLEHTWDVINGTYQKLSLPGAYNGALTTILRALEPEKDATALAAAVAQIAAVAAGFHDLGKADKRWQARARELDPSCGDELIGRTANAKGKIGIPHTPPGFAATLRACEVLMGNVSSAKHLISCVALAGVRHHSSLMNPSHVDYTFEPDSRAEEFVEQVLKRLGSEEINTQRASEVLEFAKRRPSLDMVPLALPNDDLFPIYALVGRAILVSDRESAAGAQLEEWSEESSS